ncbi:MAG: DUF2809 domain-containing protein [Bernardetiaceae bacterium]|jgi:asparagine N-glycosylation enzyme membrane subunit Stt3|nr:DUF2809 domain-containing protein [Bernardetiaceae bacterium]
MQKLAIGWRAWPYFLLHLGLMAAVIPLGLHIRRHKTDFPYLVGEFAPDALWALLLFWVFSVIGYRRSAHWVAVATLLFTWAIEVSQWYQAEWIRAVRRNFWGAMLLGHGFLWTDLVCYTTGIAVGWAVARRYFDQ